MKVQVSLSKGSEKFLDVLAEKKVTSSGLVNSNMVKPEKFDNLQLGYHFTVPLNDNNSNIRVSEAPFAILLKKETLTQVFSCEFCEIS